MAPLRTTRVAQPGLENSFENRERLALHLCRSRVCRRVRRRFAPGWSRNSWGIGLFSNVWHRGMAWWRILRQCRGPWRGEVAARTTELALRVLESPKLKADAERLEKARASSDSEAEAQFDGDGGDGDDFCGL